MENNILDKAERQIRELGVDVLVAALNGQIDIKRLLHEELADRGINLAGEQVGYAAAEDELHDTWASWERD